MSYLVLARKWRPRIFSELVGQEHVVKSLCHALDSGRLHHAYLFAGTRGVGKTTIARIFAKALNCEQGINSKPCATCSSCQEIDAGRFIDLIEVDAASRTKVDDTRELLDNVPYTPTRGRFKIYLIDEVHMLSNHSFNALLKTLEEPPPHVKFLLATTDPQKLPATVLSRCLQFNLKVLPQQVIAAQLSHIAEQEQVEFESAAIDSLADAAHGSVRDALSLLDQAIAFGGGSVKQEAIQIMLGDLGQAKTLELLTALADQDAGAVLKIIDQAAQIAADFDRLLADLISALHHIALLQLLKENKRNDAWLELRPLAERFDSEEIQLLYHIALYGKQDMQLAYDSRNAIEMILLRMLVFRPEQESTEVLTFTGAGRPIVAPSTTPVATSVNKQTQPIVQPVDQPTDASASIHTDARKSQNTQSTGVANANPWQALIDQLSISAMTRQLAENCILQDLTEDAVQLVLAPSCQALRSESAHNRLSEALNKHFAKKMRLKIVLGEQHQVNPAQTKRLNKEQIQQAAVDTIMNDDMVNQIIKRFDAQIAPESIKPKN